MKALTLTNLEELEPEMNEGPPAHVLELEVYVNIPDKDVSSPTESITLIFIVLPIMAAENIQRPTVDIAGVYLNASIH